MENQEITITKSVPQSNLPEIIKAEIDMQISTAKAYPRSITTFLQRAKGIATISEDVATSCTYTLPRGGKNLTGPSVRLAEILVSQYQNVRCAARVIANDGKTITAQGVCHDLENNVSISVEVKRSITNKYGKPYSEDMQVVTGNAACAIAFRNAVFKVIPAAVVKPLHEEIKLVAKGTAETLPARRDKCINYLKEKGVKESRILDLFDLKKMNDIDLDMLQDLRGMCSAIENNESTVNEIFPLDVKEKKKKIAKAKGENQTPEML